MEIIKTQKEAELILNIKGSLDSTTSYDLEQVIDKSLKGIKRLIFECQDLEYISSAGLRVILRSQKIMNERGGEAIFRHINNDVMDILAVTGFLKILTIE